MKLFRQLRSESRPWILASAAGLTGALPLWVEAGPPAAPAPTFQEPAPLPAPSAGARPITDSSQPLLLTSGQKSDVQRQLELLYQQNGRDMPQMVDPGIAPQTSTATPASGATRAPGPAASQAPTGVLDKMANLFRKPKTPNNPPVDPGMTYPTQSGAARNSNAPPPAPGATLSNIPSVPPAAPSSAPKPATPGTGAQPNFFQAPPAVHPLAQQNNSAPAAGPQSPGAAPQQTAALPVAQPKALPELKQMLAPEQPAAAPAIPAAPSNPTAATTSSLPVLSLSAPAAAEPKEVAAAAPVAIPPAPSDPLGELFPGDLDEEDLDADEVEKPAVATIPDSVEETRPYTGLTLDADPLTVPPTPSTNSFALRSASTASSAGVPLPPLSSPPSSSDPRSKLEKIASRKDRSGLKGFCPVMLHDHRDLVDADEAYSAIFNGKRYAFASEAAMEQFLQNPQKYAPANSGHDVIHLALTGEGRDGSLEHAVWYKGRLYLFTSAETMETFVAAPSSHAVRD